MPVNDLSVNQAAEVLAAALSQAQGGVAVSTPLNTADFVTVQQTVLKVGYDALNTAISQVLGRTIFSARPYDRKLKILEADSLTWGAHVRKINYIDGELEDDPAYSLTDGQAVDMYEVKKPKVVQTNFFGFNTFDYHQTIYKKQLQPALRGPEEWAGFLGGLMTHIQNLMEKTHEESARMTVANMIGAVNQLNAPGSVVHLITEYNAFSGESVTPETVFNPDVFPGFAKWLFGRLKTLSQMMRDRQTDLYHVNPTAGKIPRHTPVEDQRLIVLSDNFNQTDANVLSTIFNDQYLRTIPREELNFWQNIRQPRDINVTAGYMDPTTGEATSAAVHLSNVFGILYDREAMGYTMFGESYDVTPYNVRGKYWNHFWSFQDRYWNDTTENAIIMLLD